MVTAKSVQEDGRIQVKINRRDVCGIWDIVISIIISSRQGFVPLSSAIIF